MTKKLFILVTLLLVSIPNIVSLFFDFAKDSELVELSNYAFAQIVVDTAWVRRYNGSGNGRDDTYTIAVDDSGNVYVTGGSDGGVTSSDYATIKYYPNGDTAWVRRYNGPKNSEDVANAIAVDNSGNVYVSGWSVGIGTSYDYATIKYYPNGDTAWVRRYNNPENSEDYASAIALDGSGNVYITGSSANSLTHSDYATIKYDALGNQLWVKRYDGPGNWDDQAKAIAIDGFGNVYVAGMSIGDYATIKYYPDGETVWVRRYHEPGSLWSDASAMVVDISGNVYISGVSGGGGTGSDYDYVTIKYYPNGDTAWVRRYDGPGNDVDVARAIAIDASGNVYVTGYSNLRTWPENLDYATIKYYPNGDTAWVRRYYGPGDSTDIALAIAVDVSGNVYVTGGSTDRRPFYFDYATVKYDSTGNLLWVQRYNGPGNEDDLAFAIEVYSSGNVYVSGVSNGGVTGYDYATIKYVEFIRGDCDKDGNIDLSDVIFLANYVLKGGPPPDPLQSGDILCDGDYDLWDVISLARYILLGEPFWC